MTATLVQIIYSPAADASRHDMGLQPPLPSLDGATLHTSDVQQFAPGRYYYQQYTPGQYNRYSMYPTCSIDSTREMRATCTSACLNTTTREGAAAGEEGAPEVGAEENDDSASSSPPPSDECVVAIEEASDEVVAAERCSSLA